jgi:hypothetical protein
MAAKYQAGPKFTTPRAAAIWPNLNTPDTKHNAELSAYVAKNSPPYDHLNPAPHQKPHTPT